MKSKDPFPGLALIRLGGLFAGLFLPTLLLVPFGSLWLWQNGYLLHWAIAALFCIVISALVQRRMLRSLRPQNQTDVRESVDSRADPSWSPREAAAWAAVAEVSKNADANKLTSRDAVFELGARTIGVVAKRLHPEVSDPLWQFTVPEAFALLERVSRRLRMFTNENIPLGDRLTVAQLLAIYRWRGALGVAERAYDVWRFARLANPMTAATHELREGLSRKMLDLGKAHVADRLVDAYVKEVGRAAIDLYGGRLRTSSRQIEAAQRPASISTEIAEIARVTEPLRVLVVGRPRAGKSALVNALATAFHATVDVLPATGNFLPYRIARPEFPVALFIDAPALTASPKIRKAIVEAILGCDLLLLVVPADGRDLQLEQALVAEIHDRFVKLPARREPPLLVALSHIDRLPPSEEWTPPYDVSSDHGPKATSINRANAAVALGLGVAAGQIVPVSLRQDRPYNIETLWAVISENLPGAQHAKLVRQLASSKSHWGFRKLWSQAVGASKVVGRSIRR